MQQARAAVILFHIIVPLSALVLSIVSALVQGSDVFVSSLWRIALLLVPPSAVGCVSIAVLAVRKQLRPRWHGTVLLAVGTFATCAILYVIQTFDADTMVKAFAPYWLVLSVPAAVTLVAVYLLAVRYRKRLWLDDLLAHQTGDPP
ncbi:hypothetical protein [Devosia sp.]|uniref:hypothetical protein n=1 Tax=Devosia sp. TaxID=1871048 RepID=UPI003A91EFC2